MRRLAKAQPSLSQPAAARSRAPFARRCGSALGGLLLILAACGQAAAPAAQPAVSPAGAASAASGQTEFDRIVAAAKKEGKLAVITQPGNPYRQLMDDFQNKYGITVEVYAGNTQDEIISKVVTERQAGQFNWDVLMRNATQMYGGFKPLGDLDPIRPALVLPEVLDDSKWIGGFDGGWADSEKSLAYTFVAYQDHTVWVNRNVLSEAQFNSVDQLWDPQWKGKWATQDIRTGGNATTTIVEWLALKGEDRVRALLRDQQPVLTQDRRQLAQWILRGQYPIALAVDGPTMLDFAGQGLDTSAVKPLVGDDPLTVKLSHGPGSVALFNKAPHPNAAKLLLNWLLSREGAADFAQRTGYNVRRLDVPVANAESALDLKRKYLDTDDEQSYNTYYKKAIDIAKQELK